MTNKSKIYLIYHNADYAQNLIVYCLTCSANAIDCLSMQRTKSFFYYAISDDARTLLSVSGVICK